MRFTSKFTSLALGTLKGRRKVDDPTKTFPWRLSEGRLTETATHTNF